MRTIFFGFGLISILFLTLSCGSSNKDEIYSKLAEVRSKIARMEAEVSVTDDEAIAELENLKSRLEKVEDLLIEDEFERAETALAFIQESLDGGGEGGEGFAGAGRMEIVGRVRYKKTGDEDWSILEDRTPVEEIAELSVEIRSGLKIQPEKGVTVTLWPQTDVSLERGTNNRIAVHLERGLAEIRTSDAGGIDLMLDRAHLALKPSSEMTISKDKLNNVSYAALYRGACPWEERGNEGKLAEGEALFWDKRDLRRVVSLPPRPRSEDPGPGEAIGAGDAGSASVRFRWLTDAYVETFQLQISEDALFAARSFDDASISGAFSDVSLPPGRYFWRVRGLSSEGAGGPFSPVQTFEVRTGMPTGSNPDLDTPKPEGPNLRGIRIELVGSTVIVTGKTDPGSRVSVNGVVALTDDDGKFRAVVTFTADGKQTCQIIALNPRTGGETVIDRQVEIKL